MRDLFLIGVVAISLGFTLRFPFIGVLIWEWFALMNPHQEAFGFARSLPLNLLVAGTAVLSWLRSASGPRTAVVCGSFYLVGAAGKALRGRRG